MSHIISDKQLCDMHLWTCEKMFFIEADLIYVNLKTFTKCQLSKLNNFTPS